MTILSTIKQGFLFVENKSCLTFFEVDEPHDNGIVATTELANQRARNCRVEYDNSTFFVGMGEVLSGGDV